MALTNRGMYRLARAALANTSVPTVFYLLLVTADNVPTRSTNTFSELTEIAAGNGYTSGGISVARNTTDWDTSTENDSDNTLTILLKDETWTASGGSIPISGNAAAYVVLTDDNATLNSRDVIAYHSLGGNITVGNGQPLTISNFGFVFTQGT